MHVLDIANRNDHVSNWTVIFIIIKPKINFTQIEFVDLKHP